MSPSRAPIPAAPARRPNPKKATIRYLESKGVHAQRGGVLMIKHAISGGIGGVGERGTHENACRSH